MVEITETLKDVYSFRINKQVTKWFKIKCIENDIHYSEQLGNMMLEWLNNKENK